MNDIFQHMNIYYNLAAENFLSDRFPYGLDLEMEKKKSFHWH